MAQLTSAIPNGAKSHTVHDDNLLPAGTTYLIIGVTTAGQIVLNSWANPAVNVTVYLALGTHQLLGNWRQARATGLTATLSPANTVIAQTWDPNVG